YGHWTFGVFEKLGIPGPKPMISYELRRPMLAVMDPKMLKIILVKECFTFFTNRRLVLIGGEEARLIESSENLQLVDSSEFCHIRRFTQCPFIPGHK
ncbi:hypothetical protein XENOCAPTIV_026805, partial [Xenoophorus captivus]